MRFVALRCASSLRFIVALHRCASSLRVIFALHRCASSLRFIAALHRCASSVRFFVALHRCASSLRFFVVVDSKSVLLSILQLVTFFKLESVNCKKLSRCCGAHQRAVCFHSVVHHFSQICCVSLFAVFVPQFAFALVLVHTMVNSLDSDRCSGKLLLFAGVQLR